VETKERREKGEEGGVVFMRGTVAEKGADDDRGFGGGERLAGEFAGKCWWLVLDSLLKQVR